MSIVKNPILLPLQRLIGITPTPKPVVLDDDTISLVMPMVPDITRRSRASGPTGGWFIGVLENVHSAGDDEASSIDPYSPGASAFAPYPAIVEPGFDVWLLTISGLRSSGAGGLAGAVMTVNPPDNAQGWGQDDLLAPVASGVGAKLALFDTIFTGTAGVSSPPMMNSKTLETCYYPKLRIPRGSKIQFNSTSAAAAEFQAVFILGLFPEGLGQDIAG